MHGQNPQKLNIGCGQYKKEGYVNLDSYAAFSPDVLWDLEKHPYPFLDNSFDHIEADHVLEHMQLPFHTLRELHRICKNNGTITIRVPHFSRGFSHPEHRSGFDVSLPYYFDPAFKARYENDIVMDAISMRLHWAAQPHVKKQVFSQSLYHLYFGIGKLIDLFANLSPKFCSRVWCFWVGGFEEIEYIFRVKK